MILLSTLKIKLSLIRLLTLTIFLCLFILSNAYSQNIDSLIRLNTIARGGYKALKSITSITMEGNANLGNQEAKYKVYIMRPNYIRIDLIGKTNKLFQTYDGNNAWTFNQNIDPDKIDLMGFQEKERLVTEADIDGPLIDYKEKGHAVTLDGIEITEGKKTFVLLVTQIDGTRKRLYLDEKSHLVIKESTYRTIKGNSPLATNLIKAESIFEGYTNYEGYMLPKLISTYIDGKLISILKIEHVKFNTINTIIFFAKDNLKQN